MSDPGDDQAYAKPAIVFNLGQQQQDPSILEEEREKHRRR